MASGNVTPRPPPPPPPPPPRRPHPIPAPLAAAVSRVAVAQICRSAGYRAAEPAALRALADVSARYLLALARRAAASAGDGGRTDANLLDVALALEDLALPLGFPGAAHPAGRLLRPSAGPLGGLMHFVASVDEIPFATALRRETAPPPEPKPTLAPPFRHVPRWLPGFPDAWEGDRAKKGQKGEEKVGGLWEKGFLGQQPRLPPDGKGMVEREKERRLLPVERVRVRFRLRPGAVEDAAGGGGGGKKKRKVELTSVMGKPLGKRVYA
uniref:Transcription initiation factor TFIID subunit 3 n=1 Tax=Anthurium amnicola TaxID=1678845 RepID=A0A1D1XNQ9_9ARAE